MHPFDYSVVSRTVGHGLPFACHTGKADDISMTFLNTILIVQV